MSRARLLWMTIPAIIISIIIMIMGGCSKSGNTETQSPKQSEPRPAAVGTGGAGANLSDRDFVRDVAIMNMAEVELGRMAVDKSASSQIKTFAQKMIADHTAAGNKLKSAVSGSPIDWPTQLDDKSRETADQLAKKQGADFDREYLKAMIEGHQNFAAMLESRLDVQSLADWKTAAAARTQTKALPDPKTEMHDVPVRPARSGDEATMKINQWAADTYPVAQKHLDTARMLENVMRKPSTD